YARREPLCQPQQMPCVLAMARCDMLHHQPTRFSPYRKFTREWYSGRSCGVEFRTAGLHGRYDHHAQRDQAKLAADANTGQRRTRSLIRARGPAQQVLGAGERKDEGEGRQPGTGRRGNEHVSKLDAVDRLGSGHPHHTHVRRVFCGGGRVVVRLVWRAHCSCCCVRQYRQASLTLSRWTTLHLSGP
ncbi:unnamed protein product, partial [Ectocarpus sp. 12 AP-2014]